MIHEGFCLYRTIPRNFVSRSRFEHFSVDPFRYGNALGSFSNPEGRSQSLISYAATTEESIPTKTARKRRKQKRHLFGTLILLPSETIRSFDSKTGFAFLMTSPERDFDFELSGDFKTQFKSIPDFSIEIDEEQNDVIERFKRTPIYQMMYRQCYFNLLYSTFFADLTFLPCRLSKTGSWEIDWNGMRFLVDTEFHSVCHNFFPILMESVSKQNPPSKLKNVIQKIQMAFGKGFLRIQGWKDVKLFLKDCVVAVEGRWPAVGLSLDRPPPSKLSGNRICPFWTSLDAWTHQFDNQEDIEMSSDAVLYPMTGTVLLSFLAMQTILPQAIHRMSGERLKTEFNLQSDFPIQDFLENLSASNHEYRRRLAMGSFVLRFLTIINRWQKSKECTLHNSKLQSVHSGYEIRNSYLAEFMTKRTTTYQLWINWVERKPVNPAKPRFPFDREWTLDSIETEWTIDRSVEYFIQDISFGRLFKLFITGIYENLGMAATWDVCEHIGLVKLKPLDGFVAGYVRGWKMDVIDASTQNWERRFIDVNCNVPEAFYEPFCRTFGYVFVEKHRFEWAMTHPSIHPSKSKLHGWLSVIGKVIFDLFLNEYTSKAELNVSPSLLSGIFDDRRKLDICFEVGFDLQLHEIGMTAMKPIVRHLAHYYKDREAIRSNNATRNYVSNLMICLVASLAIDVGMNVKRVTDLLAPRFGKEIEETAKTFLVFFNQANRYVPTLLEAVHFTESRLSPTTFYKTLIQWMRNDSEDVIFGMLMLTKRPLPEMEDFAMFHFVEDCDIRIRFVKCPKTIHFKKKQFETLMQFQLEYFLPILPPETIRMEEETQTKKYLLAPTIDGTEEMDWEMIEHVIRKTTPKFISEVRNAWIEKRKEEEALSKTESKKRKKGEVASIASSSEAGRKEGSEAETGSSSKVEPEKRNETDILSSLNAVIQMDSQHSFRKTDKHDSFDTVFQKLLFRLGNGHVVVHSERNMGDSVNVQCLTDVSPLTLRPRSVYRTFPFDPAQTQCLPYTLSYFKCLASVPFLLDSLEKRLLAEDYRKAYDLPKTIPTDRLVYALTFDSEGDVELTRLEALGHSVLQYLYTIEIVTNNPNLHVGHFSVLRNVSMNSKENVTEEDRNFLVGHMVSSFFLPYREKHSWSPPALPPTKFRPLDVVEDSSPSNDDGSQFRIIPAVRGRFHSGLLEKVALGIPAKHFKIILALCFVHDGIEAACQYLEKIGTIQIEGGYPKRRRKSGTASLHLAKYAKLEKTLEYTFNDNKTLALAFMHSSAFPNTKDNNETLEFLGDAILDLCICRYIYEKYPNISVTRAAKLKMDLTSNTLFGWISASPPLELPVLLMQNIDHFTEQFRRATKRKITEFESFSISKICSDVFEALIGAVLVDSGYSIETVYRVVHKILHDPFTDLERFGITPPEKEN